jgi:hypothetical protein
MRAISEKAHADSAGFRRAAKEKPHPNRVGLLKGFCAQCEGFYTNIGMSCIILLLQTKETLSSGTHFLCVFTWSGHGFVEVFGGIHSS